LGIVRFTETPSVDEMHALADRAIALAEAKQS
jgi:hypothetical protein